MVEVPEDMDDVPAFGSLLVVGATLLCVLGVHEQLHFLEDVAILLRRAAKAVEVEEEEEVVADLLYLTPLLWLA